MLLWYPCAGPEKIFTFLGAQIPKTYFLGRLMMLPSSAPSPTSAGYNLNKFTTNHTTHPAKFKFGSNHDSGQKQSYFLWLTYLITA